MDTGYAGGPRALVLGGADRRPRAAAQVTLVRPGRVGTPGRTGVGGDRVVSPTTLALTAYERALNGRG
ncbi:hypothetical protein [Streptomyces cellulosae]|uniref:hypothetical protein n=1 Tax=Streptomyces cellulosae TaxID=1968 RepID=UPI0004C66D45|nr:hypothetical protein [Streptomyces cellulosae]